MPRTPVHVSLPLFSGAIPVSRLIGVGVIGYPGSPYVQTAVAEYVAPQRLRRVIAWYRNALVRWGWRAAGSSWMRPAILPFGFTFTAQKGRDITLDVDFGRQPVGGTYVAYALAAFTYPPRPARSYLRGRFVAVHIAIRQTVTRNGQSTRHIQDVTVSSRSAVDGFVHTVNVIKAYGMARVPCRGDINGRVGPAALTFVRADGSRVHAFETGPGACGCLIVDGVSGLIDQGDLWMLILRSAPGIGATGT